MEKVPQLKPKGSLLKRLKSNSSGTKLPSKRHSEANINKELPESKPNQDIISALKQLKNIYKNQGSLLAELKSSRKEKIYLLQHHNFNKILMIVLQPTIIKNLT